LEHDVSEDSQSIIEQHQPYGDEPLLFNRPKAGTAAMSSTDMILKNPNNFLSKRSTFGFGSQSSRFNGSYSTSSVADQKVGPGEYNDKYYSIEAKNSEISKVKDILGVSNKYAVYNFPNNENSKKRHARNNSSVDYKKLLKPHMAVYRAIQSNRGQSSRGQDTARRMDFEHTDANTFKGLSERLTDFYQQSNSKLGFVPRIPLTADQIN
jgi:hypothetical protein